MPVMENLNLEGIVQAFDEIKMKIPLLQNAEKFQEALLGKIRIDRAVWPVNMVTWMMR